MTTTYTEAVDQIFALFKTALNSNASAVVGYVPEIRWQGVEKPGTPDPSKYWCRVSQITVDEDQATLSDDNGKRRYTSYGLVFVQLFCPKSDVEAMAKGRSLAMIARNAFRGKTTSGRVWFRNARIKELDPDSDSIRFNIVSDYEYDEIN